MRVYACAEESPRQPWACIAAMSAGGGTWGRTSEGDRLSATAAAVAHFMPSDAIAFTYFPKLTDARGQRVSTTWERLLERLSTARASSTKHAVPGLSLATYHGDRRALDRVEHVYAVGLDLDTAVDWTRLVALFDPVDAFLHTTWSSTPEEPRARVFIRLSRPVTGSEYRRVYQACASNIERAGLVVDRAASDPSRFWFLPSTPPGGVYSYSIGRGAPANVDRALETVPAEPVAPPRRPLAASSSNDVVSRARAYLDRCEPAVSGQGGHTHTFRVTQKLVRGFALERDVALSLLLEWNERCQPPWTQRDLERKVDQAERRGREDVGSLLSRDRRVS